MIRILFLFVVSVICFISSVSAQSSEIGLFLGASTYKGELNPSLFHTEFIKPALGIFYRRNLNSHWAYRVGLNYGTVAGDDAESDIDYNVRRNLSFRSRIWDLHGLLEFNFFPYQLATPRNKFTPFLLGGLAIYRFNPEAKLGDEWYKLQPLGTEGQESTAYPERKKYKRVQVAIPFGGGFRFRVTRRFGMSIEAGARRLFTDYLDDVSTTYPDKDILFADHGEIAVLLSDRSIDGQALNNTDRQRGNASDRDWYMFAGITLNYTLSKKYSDNCTPFKSKLR